ncbi:hypothetical protein BHE74_00031351 [Ensete ventricosum]|nr:hypothetical protein BHE74_00031351 [Ensete ventricosum]RZS00874.1 hypothetical protein BHM03_00030658 [Ensete ventricosum]
MDIKENATNTKIFSVKILIDFEVYGIVSKGIELVEPLDSLPSLDIRSCYLPGQNDTLREDKLSESSFTFSCIEWLH